ncbi:MAG: DNA-3-methyladenine glycosylase 2 family protein [Clostridiales bacterium]|nr:DNA-3-methyladenine glycosylase 2 family protein [Clostridiales bacterium]
MKYTHEGDTATLTDCVGFNIAETLECGQCFRYEKLGEDEYHIIAHARSLFIRRISDKILFYKTTLQEFEDIWIPYFDLNRDYRAVKETLASNDLVMRDAVEHASGIHILRQEPWECLVSFIISQNNNIPRIRKIADTLARLFGRPIGDGIFAFPGAEELAKASLDDLLNCKTGFRAKYIVDAAQKTASGILDMNALNNMPSDKARETLMSIKGVGGKIADCVLLFAYGRTEVFPTDVWIKRVMRHFYFNKQDASVTEIHRLALSRFGEYAGFAQQYLYVYAKDFINNL